MNGGQDQSGINGEIKLIFLQLEELRNLLGVAADVIMITGNLQQLILSLDMSDLLNILTSLAGFLLFRLCRSPPKATV